MVLVKKKKESVKAKSDSGHKTQTKLPYKHIKTPNSFSNLNQSSLLFSPPVGHRTTVYTDEHPSTPVHLHSNNMCKSAVQFLH